MPANHNFNNEVPFDPGFAPNVLHFYPTLQAMNAELFRLKNFGQKKLRYKVLDKICQKALQSTLGFWVGCIFWGGFIKYKFQNDPKPISGNSFLELKKEDIPDFAYNDEFDAIENYLENYTKDAKYYLGISAELPTAYKTIVEQYRLFVDLNNNFLEAKTSTDIKIPTKFGFLEQYTEQQLDEMYAQIMQNIQNKDLSGFLKSDLF